jgi:hypothetical protein
MTLPVSGAMRLGGNVNVELGNSATAQLSLGSSSVRTLYGVASGAIRLAADGYGKSSGPTTPSYTTLTWATITKPGNSAPGYIIDNGSGTVYAAGGSTTNNVIWSSVNGGNFTEVTLPTPTTSQLATTIAKNNAGTILVMGSGTCSWISTNNGSTWTVYNFSNILPSGGTYQYTGGLCYANGYWHWCVSEPTNQYVYICTSSNGSTWTTATLITNGNAAGAYPSKALISDPTQSSAVGNSNAFGSNYMYTTSGTTWTWASTFVTGGYNQMGNGGSGSMTYATGLGWFITNNANAQIGRFTTVAGPSQILNTLYTHGANGGAAGVQAINVSGYNPVLVVSPWTANQTVRVNFNINGGASWQTSNLPGTIAPYSMLSAGSKIFVFNYNGAGAYVGTLS